MRTRTDRRRCLAFLLAVLIMITALPLVMPDLVSEEVSAASTKHYPDQWSKYNFDSKGRSFDDKHNRNKGYYLAPNGSGKYPVLMYIHGAGSVDSITKSNLISLLEYWTEKGYMNEMVIIVPSIEAQDDLGYDDTYDCFRRFAMNDSEGQKLVTEIYSDGRFDGKVNSKAQLYVSGYSMGGSVSLALGVKSSEHCTNIGAFSSSSSFYLGDGNWGWFNYASDIKYASGTKIFMSYGNGEGSGYKQNAEKYRDTITAQNPGITITYNAFDSSYGGHGSKLFTAELFSYLYYNKFGTIPSDALINSAMNPSSNPTTPTPTKKNTNTPTPTKKPTNTPTKKPTNTPTKKPTNTPTKKNTNTPTPTKKPTIKGTVTKSGKTIVGQQLSVSVSDSNCSDANLKYTWTTGGTANGYYGKTYVVRQDDVGKAIACLITDSTGKYGGQLKATFSSGVTPTPTKKPTNTPTKKPTPTNTPTAVPTPAKPSNVKAALVTATKANISWSAVSGAAGYEVYRSTSSNGTYSKCGAVTTTNRDCPGLTSWTTYYFKVRAYKEVNGKKYYGDYSSPVSIMAKGTAPKSVKAEVLTATKIRLSWTAQEGASGYEVYRSTSSGGTYSLCGAVTTAYRDCPGLTTGTRYYFKVRAYKVVNGENVYTEFCSPVSIVPKAPTTPTPTKKVTPTPTPTKKPTNTNTPTPTKKPTNTNTPTPTKKPTNTNTPTPVAAKLKSTTMEIMKGTFGDIVFVNNGKEVKVSGATFKSADSSIAAVYSDGSVAGLKEGNTKITVTYGGKTETVSVAVKALVNNNSRIAGALTPAKYAEIGNGSTDCTQTFRNLFKAAYDAGTVSDGIRRAKPIYIPSGHYVVHGSIIDKSLDISNCVFEIYGSGRESTRITFDRDGTLIDARACSPFVFTTFRDIGFFGTDNNTLLRLTETDLTSQIKKSELQTIRFVSCAFKHWKNIVYSEKSSGMISDIELAYCKITSSGSKSNMCKLFVLDDKKPIRMKFWYTDIESFYGDCIYYKSGASVYMTGGSIIPLDGNAFFFDFTDSGRSFSAGSKTTPHLICENSRFEIHDYSSCVRTTSISQEYPIVYFKNAGIGTISNVSPNCLSIHGGGDFIFQDCTDCASIIINSKITSDNTLKPRVRFYNCPDVSASVLAAAAKITNPSKDANCVRVTIDDAYDFYLKNNSSSVLPYIHSASGLKECRQNVKLDDFDYIYATEKSYTTKPYGYVRYAELVVPENTSYANKTVNLTLKDKKSGQKLVEQVLTLGAGKTYKFDINKDIDEIEVVLKQSFSTSIPVKVRMNLQLVKTKSPVADTAPVPVASSSAGRYYSEGTDASNETDRAGSLKPQDFGAVADGEADCTSAFRKMIKAAADYDKYSNSWKQSKAIYIPGGVYKITGSIIDESLGLSFCTFEISGAGKDNTFINFVKDGVLFDSEIKDQNNTAVPFAFTTFRNISFVGNNNNTFMTLRMNNKNKEGKNTDGTQRMQFFGCSFSGWKNILYTIHSTVMLSEYTFTDCKIDSCGTSSVPCKLFVLDDSESVNWRFVNTDITNFTGDAFYYISGTSIAITGGSIIPKAGNAFFFDYNTSDRRDTAGPGNSPQLICSGVKFGINSSSSCVKTTSCGQGAPVIRFQECNLGTTSYDSKKFLMINGACEIKFTDCTGCGKIRFSGYIESQSAYKPHVQFWGCDDLNLDTLVTGSEVTNAVKDFNSVRVTVGNEYDFYMRKNDSGLPYMHTVSGLNYCRQTVKLDANNYVVSGKSFTARPYGYVSYAELAVPAASSYSGKTITVTLKEKSTGKVYAQQQITLGSEQKIKLSVDSYVDDLEIVFTHSLSTGSSTKLALKLDLVKY